MNKNQFYYTRKAPKAVQVEGKEQQFDEFTDSLNVDMVVRTVEIEEGKLLVLLHDFHEETERVPILNKQGKFSGQMKNQAVFTHSEITLEKADAERFRKLTTIE